jgi:D-alanine-D-alanine ligase-like ATP-grasp enzyme
MPSLHTPSVAQFRSGKPAAYPDQSVYAAFACAELGLAFDDLDDGTGLVFRVTGPGGSLAFGAGRCSWYPQNSATAATLASDKYFTNRILEAAGVPTLGGDYFFLNDRYRAHRPDGHERDDALAAFSAMGKTAFVKPLTGSRGDFAERVDGDAALLHYLTEVARHYDAILLQKVVAGRELRIFLMDGEIVYGAEKSSPFVLGDGVHKLQDLMIRHNAALRSRGLSPVGLADYPESVLQVVLPSGERWPIAGRMNWSAGGTMVLDTPSVKAVEELARRAAAALGLRVAAVDLFTEMAADGPSSRVIEVNANPSIRTLEQAGRDDLILTIWRHTFAAAGLLSR